ncbi:MAG: 2-dehydropantoate 2-reductase [Alphaproteobacteria bacterium]
MKICVYGAGAIGGLLGAQLALAGEEVTLIARGPHLAAMRRNGLKLRTEGEERTARPACTDDPAEAGPQDAVIVTLKAPSVLNIAPLMQPLLGPGTAVVTAMNGIPWWYFHRLAGPFESRRLKSVDPAGELWRLIPPERAIGCVVYPAAEIVEPGVVEHHYGNRFMLGEPDGSRSERVVALSRALAGAGFKAPVRPRIRDDIWIKLWGNLSFNPVSALTHGTLATLAKDPGIRAVIRRMMVEGQAVGEALGVRFSVDVDTRIGWAADVGEHKTSMLQDLELGRPMEIDALVGAVVEMGALVGVETPMIEAVLALAVGRAREAGCYPV